MASRATWALVLELRVSTPMCTPCSASPLTNSAAPTEGLAVLARPISISSNFFCFISASCFDNRLRCSKISASGGISNSAFIALKSCCGRVSVPSRSKIQKRLINILVFFKNTYSANRCRLSINANHTLFLLTRKINVTTSLI